MQWSDVRSWADVQIVTSTDLTPTRHDLVLWRGDSVDLPFRFGVVTDDVFVGYDLTGVTFSGQIRTKEDATTIMASFTIDLDDQTDDDTRGIFWVRLTADTSAELVATTLPAKWDLQALWPGEDATVKTYLYGDCKIKKDTTRV